MSNRSETHALQDELTETLHNAGLPLTSFLGFTPKIENPASSNSGSSSNRLASVYSWLLEQDSRRGKKPVFFFVCFSVFFDVCCTEAMYSFSQQSLNHGLL